MVRLTKSAYLEDYSGGNLRIRFGFNGKEKDDETYGDGNEYDYKARMYNPRLGKFLSVDPLTKKFPELSTYQFAGNSPIENIDLDGLEPLKNGYVTQEMREGKTALNKATIGTTNIPSPSPSTPSPSTPKNLNTHATPSDNNEPTPKTATKGGGVNELAGGIAIGPIGFNFAIGEVHDNATGNQELFVSGGASKGLGFSIGLHELRIKPTDGKDFKVNDFLGKSESKSLSYGLFSATKGKGSSYEFAGAGASLGLGEFGFSKDNSHTTFILPLTK